ncbi:MAG: hypothetical protein H6551_10475 [Chitinophagales bacterium]|nr:hypothetical protein [Chitinophagaceae bacterium]MCB9065553.1 hypothetical protein [Chitinophagales bacterium]
MNARLNKYLPVFLIVTLAIVSRVPYMLSVDFMLDGDECIMGLMSKHFYEGKELPLFFYGQTYGFAFLEVLAISCGYMIAGVSDHVVKISVLLLWIAGCVYFYRSLLLMSNGNKGLALLVTCILILSPAWAMWSMKARGGYVSAFLVSNIVLYLSLLKSDKGVVVRFGFIGLLLVFIYQMQPLWLPGILPFVLYSLRDRPIQKLLLLASGMIVAILFFQSIAISDGYWKPAVLGGYDSQKLSTVWQYFYTNLTGYYYLTDTLQATQAAVVFVYVFVVIFLATFVIVAYRLIRGGENKGLIVIGMLSVLLSLSYNLFIDLGSPRYALPLFGYTLLFVTIVFNQEKSRPVVSVIFVGMILIGSYSMYLFRDFRFHEISKRSTLEAVEKIKQEGVTHVYCTGPLMQWELAFYSNEDIIARYYYSTDRYMPYIKAVDSVYMVAPERSAIVGKYGPVPDSEKTWINYDYFICKQPSPELLNVAGFQISE